MSGPVDDQREDLHRARMGRQAGALRPSMLFAPYDELRGGTGSTRVELTATIAGRALSFSSSDEAEAFARAIGNVASALKALGQ